MVTYHPYIPPRPKGYPLGRRSQSRKSNAYRSGYTAALALGSGAFATKVAYNTMFPKKAKTTTKKNAKQIKVIKKKMNHDMARHTHRRRDIAELGPGAVNTKTFDTMEANTQTRLELAMAAFRYYDPATPGTLVTAAAGTGTYQREIYCESFYSKITVRNNYQVPCNVAVYCCKAKGDTDVSTHTSVSNGLTDQGNPGINSPMVFPTDSMQFKQLYTIESSKKQFLQPGQQCSLSCVTKPFYYDPSLNDSEGDDHQSRWEDRQWLITVDGPIAHDSGGGVQEVGTLQCGVDCLTDNVWKFSYDAGVQLDDISVDQNSSTFTTGGVLSNKAVSDNQGFSVA